MSVQPVYSVDFAFSESVAPVSTISLSSVQPVIVNCLCFDLFDHRRGGPSGLATPIFSLSSLEPKSLRMVILTIILVQVLCVSSIAKTPTIITKKRIKQGHKVKHHHANTEFHQSTRSKTMLNVVNRVRGGTPKHGYRSQLHH